MVEAELKEEEDEKIKNILQTNFNQEISSSSHSLSFLDWIKEIAKILDKDDQIHFSLKEDTPIKIQTDFTKLGDSSLLYFLAPRGLKKDAFDDDELAHHFKDGIVWLNPELIRPEWNPWTRKIISSIIPMYDLSIEGIEDAMKFLRKGGKNLFTTVNYFKGLNY